MKSQALDRNLRPRQGKLFDLMVATHHEPIDAHYGLWNSGPASPLNRFEQGAIKY